MDGNILEDLTLDDILSGKYKIIDSSGTEVVQLKPYSLSNNKLILVGLVNDELVVYRWSQSFEYWFNQSSGTYLARYKIEK